MSEYTERVVVCDGCYPDFLPAFTFFRLENIKGVFRGTYEEAVKEEGWQERDFGHICPICIAAETEGGDGEVVLGSQAVIKLFEIPERPREEEN